MYNSFEKLFFSQTPKLRGGCWRTIANKIETNFRRLAKIANRYISKLQRIEMKVRLGRLMTSLSDLTWKLEPSFRGHSSKFRNFLLSWDIMESDDSDPEIFITQTFFSPTNVLIRFWA